ncbi:MAG: helix-turn-helix transcriptional regulator, partial [Firmicutes bacterium]|nr:helix-turn-helix transcriptional regulator [Bacillota bacterium]
MNRIPVIDMTATGINITRMRINAGLTVKDLQDIFGFSTPQAIYKWQRGTALPTVDNLVVLATVFGVKIDDILIFQVSRQICISA